MTEHTTQAETISVRIGELAAASGDTIVKTLLGSCVGVALYDSGSRVGGLAHVVLPDSGGREGPAGKYVDTAIPELIGQIEKLGGCRRNLRAKLAGGADMFATNSASGIGDQNVAAAREKLSEHNIRIVAEHCGGYQGRRMTFLPAVGNVRIDVVGADSVEI